MLPEPTLQIGIRRASSTARDPADAVVEMHHALTQPGAALTVLFCSASFDLEILGAEIGRHFTQGVVIGCTTAGEITPTGYQDGGISGFSLSDAECVTVAQLIPDISALTFPEGARVSDDLLERLASRTAAIDRDDTFALLLIDGLCATEETVLAAIHRRLDPIPLLGGSAGDDMRFERTHVYWNGAFHADAAILLIAKLNRPFRIFRRQHFAATETRMVVTGAEPASRIVTEINAEPAAHEYARIIGVDPRELTPALFAWHPLMVRVGGDYYVRSIQKANDDGSLTFYCAIDEGVVLTLAEHKDLVADLDALFRDMRRDMGEPLLVIGFDCILRSLEAQTSQVKHLASSILAANNVIGFSTYGEQLAAMHINHTFTGLLIGSATK